MRLLNKTSFELKWFLEGNRPPYIILSHRWLGAETTLQEFSAERHLNPDKWSAGTAKTLRFCKEVENYHEEWVWVDTCCIDKTSSAELQEAINSMFRWYQHAELCLAYLDDVEAESSAQRNQFTASQWFTRGWTLQELLAPKRLLFLDSGWGSIGYRFDLRETLETITGIDKECFVGDSNRIWNTPVAIRMSWVSERTTSRSEDIAYCMLGIFNISMTMLYGEGRKAFVRLQKEIIQESDDESIFLWGWAGLPPPPVFEEWNCFPTQHRVFSLCRHLRIKEDRVFDREPYRMTNRGLEFETYGRRDNLVWNDELEIPLNCTVDGKRAMIRIGRHFQGVSKVTKEIKNSNKWVRRGNGMIETLEREEYSPPPTVFESHQTRLQEQYQGMSHMRNQFNPQLERIRFKVYIL